MCVGGGVSFFLIVLLFCESKYVRISMHIQVQNQKSKLCLDNNEYLFLGPEPVQVKDCNYEPEKQVLTLLQYM